LYDFVDGLIVALSAYVFSLEKAFYAIICIYVSGKVIDIVQFGLSHAKMAIIISDRAEEIRQAILYEINRGVTQLPAIEGYTKDNRPVLMCVLEKSELTKLKQLVNQVDPSAFMVISNSVEVWGEGFRLQRGNGPSLDLVFHGDES
jgi:uncharacterized membrane-anchored protein YitT (DUF2179 family)